MCWISNWMVTCSFDVNEDSILSRLRRILDDNLII